MEPAAVVLQLIGLPIVLNWVELWEHADPELTPRVDLARQRLIRLVESNG